jgi:transposase
MVREDLEALSKEELIDLILAQAEQFAQLQPAFRQLQADHEALKKKFEHNQKPPTSSQNSSQPPSRDQKGSMPQERRKRRHGPPAGHPKHERVFVANPDHIVEVRTDSCPDCQADLGAEAGLLLAVNQITELPVTKAEVIEVRQYAVTCRQCGGQHVAQPPEGLEMGRTFGARLEATLVYYRQEQHISYQRAQGTLRDLHGVTLSQGGIDQIMQRTGKKALKEVETIQERVRQSAVILSDETGSRVDGSNWWHWVFCGLTVILHVIRFNRSADVIKDVMGVHQAEVWVSDCQAAQLKAPARQRQICLSHQLRNLQAVVDRYPGAFWAQAMQALFRYAIHLRNQRDQLPPEHFHTQVARIERLCDWLIGRPLSQPEASKLQRRYRKLRQHLFVFLYRTDVPPTNNLSERTLRPSVIHRKVIGCFRSDWGAQAYAALESVIDTAALSGTDAFQAIQHLIGRPALPLPLGGE